MDLPGDINRSSPRLRHFQDTFLGRLEVPEDMRKFGVSSELGGGKGPDPVYQLNSHVSGRYCHRSMFATCKKVGGYSHAGASREVATISLISRETSETRYRCSNTSAHYRREVDFRGQYIC